MTDKKIQLEQIRKFRDSLKEYQEICRKFWRAINHFGPRVDDADKTVESETREFLTEEWGRLEHLFNKIGAPTHVKYPSVNIVRPIFDEALSPNFEGSIKGECLQAAIGSATKAIGLLDAMSETQYKGVYRSTPNIFIGHSFKKDHKNTIDEIINFLSTFPISITTGEKPSLTGVTSGVPEKVKRLIDDADLVIGILTKDDQSADGKMTPSKWVSDEIAYAIGKEKIVIRLQENGVEFKPTLSGDAEYVPFSQNNLSESFRKLSELINSFLKG